MFLSFMDEGRLKKYIILVIDMVFCGHVKGSSEPDQLAFQLANSVNDAFMQGFDRVKNNMVTLIKEIKSICLFDPAIKKKDMIRALADTIMRYATNAIASLEFKVSMDNRFSRTRIF